MSASRTASGMLRRAELASTLGAAVLGAGIALLLSEVLRPHALLVGCWLSLGLAGYVPATAL